MCVQATGGSVDVASTTAEELPDAVDDIVDFVSFTQFYQWGGLDEHPHGTAADLQARDGARGRRH